MIISGNYPDLCPFPTAWYHYLPQLFLRLVFCWEIVPGAFLVPTPSRFQASWGDIKCDVNHCRLLIGQNCHCCSMWWIHIDGNLTNSLSEMHNKYVTG